MNIAVYVRVSTQRQAQAQTIEQQLESLRTYHEAQGWPWQEEHIFRDDGYSGAKLPLTGSRATTCIRCSSLRSLNEGDARWNLWIDP